MLHTDGKPLDYQDDTGMWWIMAACGHRCGVGTQMPSKHIPICPNCRLLIHVTHSIPVVYEDRVGRLEEPNSMNITKHPVRQYPGKKGNGPAAACPDCPVDYLPAPGGGSTKGGGESMKHYPTKQVVKK